jgi:hypothetical protein
MSTLAGMMSARFGAGDSSHVKGVKKAWRMDRARMLNFQVLSRSLFTNQVFNWICVLLWFQFY